MSGFLDDWLPPIPQNWRVKPLFALATERSRPNTGLPESRVLSLSYGKVVERDVESNYGLLPETFEGYNIVEPDDIVMRLTDLQNDQRSLRTGQVTERGIITSAYVTIVPSADLTPRFAHFLLHGYDLAKVFYRMGGGLRQSLKYADLKRLPLLVPPRSEQTRIANFLDEQTARIDALIAEKERLVSTIEEYWRSYLYSSMQSAACLGLEPPHGGWALEPVKRVCASIQTGRTPSGARDDCFTEDGVPWVTPGDMDDIFVKSSGKSVSYVALHDGEAVLYPPGSTLLVGIGATLGTVSNARVAVSANQQINILVPDPRKIDALFLTFAIKANQDQVRLSAGAATLPILNQERTGRLKIAIPRMEQQIATRSQLLRLKENANRLLSHVGRHISILREYRSSLISAAVTGQLDIDNFGIGG